MASKIKPDAFKKICPSRDVMARLGEKWTMLMIVTLENGPMRFGELRRKIEGISQKMLSHKARHLERDGLVIRHVVNEKPLHIEYELNQRGYEFLEIIRSLKSWAEKHLHDIVFHAEKFDETHRTKNKSLN